MDFHNYTTVREVCKRSGGSDVPVDDPFYDVAAADAVQMGSGQFLAQLQNEQRWEHDHRPYYNVWPSIVPMLTRPNLDIESALIQLPLPTLCVRFPKQKNQLAFDCQGQVVHIRCMMLGEFNEGRAISVLIDVGEVMRDGSELGIPIYTYRNFPRKSDLTVDESIAGLRHDRLAEVEVQIPESLIMDCVRLCCSLCLLENDASVIEPDVLSKDRAKFEHSGDEKYVAKAHRRGKVGWNVGRRIEVAPHYRRPHMTLVWTGRGRAVPRVVPRRGSVVHRELVENIPSGFGG